MSVVVVACVIPPGTGTPPAQNASAFPKCGSAITSVFPPPAPGQYNALHVNISNRCPAQVVSNMGVLSVTILSLLRFEIGYLACGIRYVEMYGWRFCRYPFPHSNSRFQPRRLPHHPRLPRLAGHVLLPQRLRPQREAQRRQPARLDLHQFHRP